MIKQARSDKPLIEFNPRLPKLSKNEKVVLRLLIEIGKLTSLLYLEQENPKFPGANFYPHDATKKEIEEAAKKNKDILSPYTVVERVGGRLLAVPYHQKYAQFLKPIAEKLSKASTTTENKEFAKFLKLQAKALTEGAYKEAIIAGLQMKPYTLDISIGPIEHYDDQLFFAKASYQCWVGILDVEGTEKLDNYKSITLGGTRKALMPAERINNYNQVKTKVDDVILFSGLLSRTKFVGVSLPNDLAIVEEYGSEITLFNQPNDLRVKEQIVPTFNNIFSKAFREGFSYEDLRRGYLRAVALHELAHSFLHYRNAAKNLQDLFPCIDELAATVLGLKMAGSLLLKDRITNKQLESMMVAFLCRSFSHVEAKGLNKPLINYALGGAIFINFMVRNGALKQSGGMMIPNFMKIFVALHELFSVLEQILSSGTRKEAEIFIKKYTKA